MFEFQALLCGVCGYAFEDEGQLRQHQTELDEDGDLHDGEPWGSRWVRVGDVGVWEPSLTDAREKVRIVALNRNADGEGWVQSEDPQGGRHWSCLARWCEAVGPQDG